MHFDAYQMAYANQLLTRIGTGRISIYNGSAAPVHVTLDLTGFVVGGANRASGTTVATKLARVLDTGTGTGAPRTPLRPDRRLDVQISGRGGIPASGVAGVWIKVTVAAPQGRGFLVAWPAGRTRPSASTVTFAAGQTVANQVFLPLDSSGRVSFMNRSGGSLRLIGDVVGHTRAGTVTAEGALSSLSPQRVLDTQTGNGAAAKPVASRRSITLQVAGRAGVPLMGARAVLLNLAAGSAQSTGYLTMYAGHTCIPNRYSTINFGPGRTISNMVLAPLAPDGTVTFFNASNGTVRITADVTGWIRGPQAPAGALSISNGASPSGSVSMTDDGRYVTFGGYIWDPQTRATTRFSSSTYLESRPYYCESWQTPLSEGYGLVSGDGQYVMSHSSPFAYGGDLTHLWKRSDQTRQRISIYIVSSMTVTDDGSHVVYLAEPGAPEFFWPIHSVLRWDRATGESEAVVNITEEEKSIRNSRISGNGRTIVYGVGTFDDESGPIDIFRWREGQSEKIGQGIIHDISDDGNVLLYTRTDGEVKHLSLWSNGTSADLATEQPNLARLSGDGRVVVWQRPESADSNGPMIIYRKELGEDATQIFRYPSGSRATGFALSRDGSRLAYAESTMSDNWTRSVGVFVR